jgi:hypothetical protein
MQSNLGIGLKQKCEGNAMSLYNKSTNLPKYLSAAEKRNVVVTDAGFVRRTAYTDQNGHARVKDEILATISGLANTTNWGTAGITDLWHSVSTIAHSTVAVNTWVSFSEPISSSGLSGKLKLTVANTAGGNNMVAYSDGIVYGGNKLVFRWKPGVAGTYKVQAQTAANASATSANVRSTNSGTEVVGKVVSGVSSNTAGSVTVS